LILIGTVKMKALWGYSAAQKAAAPLIRAVCDICIL